MQIELQRDIRQTLAVTGIRVMDYTVARQNFAFNSRLRERSIK